MRLAGLDPHKSDIQEARFELNYEELADSFHASGIHYEGDILLVPTLVQYLEQRGVKINDAKVEKSEITNRGAAAQGEGVMEKLEIWCL